MKRTLFGTDGIRGLANTEPLTPETALALGRVLAVRCAAARADARPRLVIGKDTRHSGDMLESAFAAGVCAGGADALLAGVLPTPGVACLTRSLGADAGAVISASHNHFADNGIKLFASDGFKLPDAIEREIESDLQAAAATARPTGSGVGRTVPLADAEDRYLETVRRVLPADAELRGLRVVIDAAHGAAYRVAPRLFVELGAQVSCIGADPNGVNINDGLGAVHPESLRGEVLAAGAHFGVALDGDADRAIFVDERGDVVDGDEVLALAADDMLARGCLRGATVVATVMSNLGLEVALRRRGARLVRTAVGDRYVIEEMRRGGFNLGGEQSGHLLFLDHATTGDGMVAALYVARLLIDGGRPLSELKRAMTKYPQTLVNVRVARREDLDASTPVQKAIARVRAALGDHGRVLVRFSGTEPLVRVMVEGEDADSVRAHAQAVADAVRAALGQAPR